MQYEKPGLIKPEMSLKICQARDDGIGGDPPDHLKIIKAEIVEGSFLWCRR